MAEFKRTTRADVARYAGVSETIVSYVINNNRYVDKEKRRRVEEAVKELNYRPNNVARALKGKRSDNIVFIADQINNEHFNQVINEMDKYAYQYGYLISLCANRNTKEFISQIISRQYDGIVISSLSIPESFIQSFVDAHIPTVVLVNRTFKELGAEVGRLYTGLEKGARQCVRHLISRGRRHILYIDRFSNRGVFSTMDDLRFAGFVKEMKSAGLPLSEKNVITGYTCEQEVENAVRERIQSGMPVDAIFGRNDRLACLAMGTVLDMGLRVPEDIAVVGFDNSTLSKYLRPSLTTMDMPRQRMAKASIDMLRGMIEGNPPESVHLEPTLLERESTAFTKI